VIFVSNPSQFYPLWGREDLSFVWSPFLLSKDWFTAPSVIRNKLHWWPVDPAWHKEVMRTRSIVPS
jgi:hypothetical protein